MVKNGDESILSFLYGANLQNAFCGFIVGKEIATFLLSTRILSKSWEESHLASNSESFCVNEYEGVAYVALHFQWERIWRRKYTN